MTAPALPGGGNSVAGVSVPLPLEDYDTGSNSSSQALTFVSPASVTATKTASGTFEEGTNVTYTVTLTNDGSRRSRTTRATSSPTCCRRA
jgi:hypothetical protein